MLNIFKHITMQKKYRAIWLLCFVLFIGTMNVNAQDMLTVIGNSKGVPTQMKMGQLVSVLRGERQRWSDGTKVVIALMKTNTPVGMVTLKKVYNMTENEFNKKWLALVFQGKADAPTFFNSVTELENFVSQTPGAIGILSNVSNNSTRSITVEGKRGI
jgi:F0F1-type ATP synthase alpha subunit